MEPPANRYHWDRLNFPSYGGVPNSEVNNTIKYYCGMKTSVLSREVYFTGTYRRHEYTNRYNYILTGQCPQPIVHCSACVAGDVTNT